MRRPAIVLLFALAACEPPPPEPPPRPLADDPDVWLERMEQELCGAMTAQWSARVVREAKGESVWRFRTRGADQLHYVCDEATEAWCEGGPLYIRRGQAGLAELEWTEHEARNLVTFVSRAGIFAWLASRARRPFESVRGRYARGVKSEAVDGRPAVCIGQDLEIGGADDDWRRFGSSLVWIDRETARPLKRELEILGEGRVTEIYTNWRLDELIDERAFHAPGAPVPGTVPRSRDPDAYEAEATKLYAGVELASVPDASVEELGAEKLQAPALNVESLGEMKDPDAADGPAHDRPMFNAVARRTPDGRRLEAWAGTFGDLTVEPAGWIPAATVQNRRHRYEGLGNFVGQDLFVGEVEGTVMRPALFFRDFGQHEHGVVDFAVDAEGRCHVGVVDVDQSRGSRAKVLYLVGDPATHAWTEAWQVHHRTDFTSGARSAVCAGGGAVDLAWAFDGEGRRVGVYFVERAKAFSRPLRVWDGATGELAMARDSAGAVLLVWSPGVREARRVFRAIVRRPDGTWTRPADLDAFAEGQLGLASTGAGTFRLRAYAHKTGRRAAGLFERVTEWTLRVEAP